MSAVLVVGRAALGIRALVWFWPRPPLEAALTAPASPPARLVCSGYVDSRHGPLLLQPARAGRVVRVFVQEKQDVSTNAPLVQLDDRFVKLQEQEAALAIQAAQLQLTKAKDGLKQYQARLSQAVTIHGKTQRWRSCRRLIS